jgi:peptide/nickel transport system permease protein
MGRFALRRLSHGIIVIFGVTIVVFVVTRLVGDPVQTMLPLEATAAQVEAFRQQLGFDRPIPIQFFDYLRDLARFDFGESLWQRRSAGAIVAEHLPRTFQLVGASMVLAVILSVPLGIIAALRPGRMLDRVTVTLSLVGLSVPQFWLGLLFIMFFSVQLGWLPTSGMGTWRHMVLPTLTLALPATGRIAMLVRSSMIDELNKQYIQTARAKNLPFLRIVGLHAFRNASIPALTLAAWELIRALAGYSVIVETVFAWPGLGLAAIQAVERQDLILLQAIVFVVALLVVIVNITVDIIYKFIDPRIKLA